MLLNPIQQFLILHRSSRNGQADLRHFRIGALQADSVDLQKDQHHIHSDPLVSVHKRMVGNQLIAEPCPFSSLEG